MVRATDHLVRDNRGAVPIARNEAVLHGERGNMSDCDAQFMAATRALSKWPQVVAYVWSDEAKGMSAEEVVKEIERRWPEAHAVFMGAFCPYVKKEEDKE